MRRKCNGMLQRCLKVYHNLSVSNNLSNTDAIKTPEINDKDLAEPIKSLPNQTYLPIYQLFAHTVDKMESSYKVSIKEILKYINKILQNCDHVQLFPIKELQPDSNDDDNNYDVIDSSSKLNFIKSIEVSSHCIMKEIKISGYTNCNVQLAFMLELQTPTNQKLIADLLNRHSDQSDVMNDLVSILENECHFSVFKRFNSTIKAHYTFSTMEEVLWISQMNIKSNNVAEDYDVKMSFYDSLNDLKFNDLISQLDFDNIENVRYQLNDKLKCIYDDAENELILR